MDDLEDGAADPVTTSGSESVAAFDVRLKGRHHPGDSRALQVMPHQVLVSPEVDVTSSTLFAATGTYRADPTVMIACPQPCNVRYAATYSWYQRHTTRYAGSWERQGDNFSLILEYEFENHILAPLGYSLKWR